jgi:hypothetical protein
MFGINRVIIRVASSNLHGHLTRAHEFVTFHSLKVQATDEGLTLSKVNTR